MQIALTFSQAKVLIDANAGLFPHDTDEWATSQGDIQTLMGLGLAEMSEESDLILAGYASAIVEKAASMDYTVLPVESQVLFVFNL